MADPIRAALEGLIAAWDRDPITAHQWDDGWDDGLVKALGAARAALAAQPPAPASDTLLDLDALLSPEGAYARGDGTMDGAQFIGSLMGFVNGHGWWEPQHGCETLDVLLWRIRARILPHLRPPIAGIDVPGTVTDLVRSLLARRPFVSEGTLLDCLELAEWLGPRIWAGLTPLLTTAELEARWHCDQSTVSRRMQALRVHQLIDSSLHPGRGAYWAVRRVGPVV